MRFFNQKIFIIFFYEKSFYRIESICCANETDLEFRLESNLRIDFKK
jgi:hypothetical protein